MTIALWSANSLTTKPDASVATLGPIPTTGRWTTGAQHLQRSDGYAVATNRDDLFRVRVRCHPSRPASANTLHKFVHPPTPAARRDGASAVLTAKFTDEQGIQTGSYSESDKRLRIQEAQRSIELRNQPGEIRAYWTDSETNEGSSHSGGLVQDGALPHLPTGNVPKRARRMGGRGGCPSYGASNLSVSGRNRGHRRRLSRSDRDRPHPETATLPVHGEHPGPTADFGDDGNGARGRGLQSCSATPPGGL